MSFAQFRRYSGRRLIDRGGALRCRSCRETTAITLSDYLRLIGAGCRAVAGTESDYRQGSSRPGHTTARRGPGVRMVARDLKVRPSYYAMHDLSFCGTPWAAGVAGYRGSVERITIRGTSTNLPAFPEDMELTRFSSLGRVSGQLSRFSLDDHSMRALDVQDVGLYEGKIHLGHAESVSIRRASARSLKFSECNLSMLRWSGGDISTTWFDNCKLLGARFDDITLSHVAFTNCKLDYSTFSRIRTSGPVIFARCSLREVDFENCQFSQALFDECELVLTGFGHGNYRGCDLRGNDLSAVIGINNLKSVIINRYQLAQFAEAMASELDVTFGDDLPAE